MKNKEMASRTEERMVYYVYCPLCKKEIKGTKPSQVKYNLQVHKRQAHRRKT